ncbi:hypothetical protein BC374_18680 [Ensifer sp. LC13]|nr:hypothetical protein BC374_18680 [Ensifer sp. LC13]OCP33225.1 hypothetical protein BC364_17780 [Ensifer sp. LC499]
MNGFLTEIGSRLSSREGALTALHKNREKQNFSVFFALLRLAVGIFPRIALKNIAKCQTQSFRTDRQARS